MKKLICTTLLVVGIALNTFASDDEHNRPVPSQGPNYTKVAGYSLASLASLVRLYKTYQFPGYSLEAKVVRCAACSFLGCYTAIKALQEYKNPFLGGCRICTQ